jgi:iron(III) transport system permease protein
VTEAALRAPPRMRRTADNRIMLGGIAVVGLFLLVAVALPLVMVLWRSLQTAERGFAGLANYAAYFADPALIESAGNSIALALIGSAITLLLAFAYAYALTRSAMPCKTAFRAIALIPILMPSLLPAISLVYLFGKQGVLRDWLFGASVYGPIGIVMGQCFYVFPHALMILVVALSTSDARLYEAAVALRAGPLRRFLTVTLPGARYGLISAFFVAFTLIITDFGVPKVIGGQFNVLATDVYKQVVGRLDFEMGAVVGMVLLAPALAAFAADRLAQRRQVALLSARAVPYAPKPSSGRDISCLLYCGLIAVLLIGMLGMAGFASLVTFWPYNLTLSLKNYQFDLVDGGGWQSFWNSLRMALGTAVFGTAIVFAGAYLAEKSPAFRAGRMAIQFLGMIPMAVPGLVLGLAYIFFFNAPENPLGFLYHGMAILVLCTIAHFYTVSHLTAVTALKQMDREFEAVSASLKVPFYRTFARVTVPVCAPAILDISIYFFVNAMTTVSAVVFLYGPDTALAAVAVLNMDDAGDIAPAAAMGMMIVMTSAGVKLLHALATSGLLRRVQAWRAPAAAR